VLPKARATHRARRRRFSSKIADHTSILWITIRVARLERENRFFKLTAAGAALGDIETETVWDVKAPAIADRGLVLLRVITEVGVNGFEIFS
jgi:hypothetical protein